VAPLCPIERRNHVWLGTESLLEIPGTTDGGHRAGYVCGTCRLAAAVAANAEDDELAVLTEQYAKRRPLSAARLQLDGYLSRIIDQDFPEQGLRVRRPAVLRAWMAAYATAIGSTTSYERIAKAASPDGQPSRMVTAGYREALGQLWMLDAVPAWLPSSNQFSRLASTPKHFLADPALAARLLGLGEARLLRTESIEMLGPQDGTSLGRPFEHLVALSLQTYAQAAEPTLSHFRSQNDDREVDFIVHSTDGGTVGFEAKLSRTVSDSDVKHLLWLKQHLGDELRDMVVINTGPAAYRRPDGVAVVPLALLSP